MGSLSVYLSIHIQPDYLSIYRIIFYYGNTTFLYFSAKHCSHCIQIKYYILLMQDFIYIYSFIYPNCKLNLRIRGDYIIYIYIWLYIYSYSYIYIYIVCIQIYTHRIYFSAKPLWSLCCMSRISYFNYISLYNNIIITITLLRNIYIMCVCIRMQWFSVKAIKRNTMFIAKDYNIMLYICI